MNSIIDDIHTIDLILGLQICIKALLNIVDNWPPGLIVVDKITKTWSVDDGEAKTHTILFNVGANRLDRDSLWDNVKAGPLALLWWVERRVK
jgi:hypothetical protein